MLQGHLVQLEHADLGLAQRRRHADARSIARAGALVGRR